jgi:hypothetical protein
MPRLTHQRYLLFVDGEPLYSADDKRELTPIVRAFGQSRLVIVDMNAPLRPRDHRHPDYACTAPHRQ